MVADRLNHVADSAEAMRAAHSNMRAAAGDHVRQAVNHVADSAEAAPRTPTCAPPPAALSAEEIVHVFDGLAFAFIDGGRSGAGGTNTRTTHERAMDVEDAAENPRARR